MEVKFTTYNKEENSLARPTDFSASYDCILLDDCTTENPAIKLNVGQSGNPTAYNYAYIGDFSRYYFISNWRWSGRLWIAEMTVDVLASYRDTIKNSTQYVTRAASMWDVAITDTAYPAKNNFSFNRNSATPSQSWVADFTKGTYVVGLIGGDGDTGSISYYEMTPATFRAFTGYLFNTSLYGEDDIIKDITSALWKSMYNPFQYVVSVMWFPFTDTGGTPVTKITFGWYNVGCSCRLITDPVRTIDVHNVKVSKHPRYSSGKGFSYLNAAPWAQYTLHYMPWGDIPVNASYLYGVDNLLLQTHTDLISGRSVLYMYAGTGTTIPMQSYTAQVGVPVQIAQQNTDFIGAAGTLITGLAATATGAAGLASAALGTTSSIGDALSNMLPSAQSAGAQGGVVGLDDDIYLTCKFATLSNEDPEHIGYPLMQRVQLGTLTGFCRCENVRIATSGSDAETRAVKNYLESGVYIV